jgi:hypothetical protein
MRQTFILTVFGAWFPLGMGDWLKNVNHAPEGKSITISGKVGEGVVTMER